MAQTFLTTRGMTLKIDVGAFLDELRRLGPRAKAAAGKALYAEGWRIMTRSKGEFVPVDFGALKSTGDVSLPEESAGGGVSVTLGYGGPAKTRTRDGKMFVGYAIVVHENLQAHHPVGGAKYLERPVLEAVGGMEGRLAADLRKELEKR